MAEELTDNRINGEFLGYPSCCIKAFGDPAIPFAFRPTAVKQQSFNQFIPCLECAKKLETLVTRDEFIEYINLQRLCTVPFKEQHTPEEAEEITTQLWQLITKDA